MATGYIIELMWNQDCDQCDETIYAGERAYFNPTNRLVYHPDCFEIAEAG